MNGNESHQPQPSASTSSSPPSWTYSPHAYPRRSRLSKTFKNLSLLGMGSVGMLALLVGLGLWRTGAQFLWQVRALFSAAPPEARADVRSIVVQQVRSASELTTAVLAMETVVPTSKEQAIGGIVIGKTTLLYIAYGEVRAGVDLSALKAEDVQQEQGTLVLRLPPPRILDSKVDVNRSSVYDYDRGFLSLGPDAAPELQQLAQRQTLEKIVSTACTSGLLQQASDRAKFVVSQLLTTAGYVKFTVETQPPAANACLVTPPAVNLPSSVSPSSSPSPAIPVEPLPPSSSP